jgi:methionine sulfoxide reductase heme-binding subunit
MIAAAVTEHLFWITSRAAGTAALLLSSLAVCVGLLFGGKLVKGRPDLRHLHEALSLATIVALVVHAVSLLGDGFLRPSVADITIPFVSGYMRLWTTVGIVAGWAMIALGLSYYVRDRIGRERWKRLHRFTALAWIAGLAHSFGEGTDAGQTWFIVATAIVVVPALVLLVVRHLGPAAGARSGAPEHPRPAATPETAGRSAHTPTAAPSAASPTLARPAIARHETARAEAAR